MIDLDRAAEEAFADMQYADYPRIITPEDTSDLTTELMEEQSATIAQLEAERDALRQELGSLRRRIGWQAEDSEAIGAKALLDSRTTHDGLTAAVEMARHAVYTLNARYLRSMLETGAAR